MPSSQFVACSFVFHSHDLRLPFEGSGSSVELMSSCVCVYMYAHIHIFLQISKSLMQEGVGSRSLRQLVDRCIQTELNFIHRLQCWN